MEFPATESSQGKQFDNHSVSVLHSSVPAAEKGAGTNVTHWTSLAISFPILGLF